MFRTGPWKTSKQCSTRVFLWGALDLFWTLLALRGFLGLLWGLSRDYRKLYGLSWDYREVSWDRRFFGQFGAILVFPWVSGPRADNIATKCPKALGDGCFVAYPGQSGAILIPFLWAFFVGSLKPRASQELTISAFGSAFPSALWTKVSWDRCSFGLVLARHTCVPRARLVSLPSKPCKVLR